MRHGSNDVGRDTKHGLVSQPVVRKPMQNISGLKIYYTNRLLKLSKGPESLGNLRIPTLPTQRLAWSARYRGDGTHSAPRSH